MPDSIAVPQTVERFGLVWNVVDRGDGSWGIQQGLSHQGVLERTRHSAPNAPTWRVTTSAIPYEAPEDGFPGWSEAIDDFLTSAGADAVDLEN